MGECAVYYDINIVNTIQATDLFFYPLKTSNNL